MRALSFTGYGDLVSEPKQPQAWPADAGDVWETTPLARVADADRPRRVAREQPVARQRPRPNGYLLKGIGLLAVSVISGVTWYLTHQDSRPGEDQASRAAASSSGKFDFTMAGGPVRDTDCAAHSYSAVRKFFTRTQCEQLTRTLYTSQPTGSRIAVSSVSVVRMPNPGAARRLARLTNSDGTGNVTDLPADGVTVPGAPDTLRGGGYASSVHGATVTIVESDYAGTVPGTKATERLLVRISRDALRLGG